MDSAATGITIERKASYVYTDASIILAAQFVGAMRLEVYTSSKAMVLSLSARTETGGAVSIHSASTPVANVADLLPEGQMVTYLFSVNMTTGRAAIWFGEGAGATRIDFLLDPPPTGFMVERQVSLISGTVYGEGEFVQYWDDGLDIPAYSATPVVEPRPVLGEYVNATWENGPDGIGQPNKRIEANDLGEPVERGKEPLWVYPAAQGPVIPEGLPTTTVAHRSTTYTIYGEPEIGYSEDGTMFVVTPPEGLYVTKSPEVQGAGSTLRNGWELNPIAEGSSSKHGYDGRVSSYRAYKTAGPIQRPFPGETIIAAVSSTEPDIENLANGERFGLIQPDGISIVQFVSELPVGLPTKTAGSPIKFKGRPALQVYDIDWDAKIAEHITPHLVDTSAIVDQTWRMTEEQIQILERPQPLVGQATAANNGYECLMTFTWLSFFPQVNNYGRGMAVAWNKIVMNILSTDTSDADRKRIVKAFVKMGLDWEAAILHSYPNGFGGNGAHHTFEQIPCYMKRVFLDEDTTGFWEQIQGTWSTIGITQQMLDVDFVPNNGEMSISYPIARKPSAFRIFTVLDIDADGYLIVNLADLPGRMSVTKNVRLLKVGTSLTANAIAAQPADKTGLGYNTVFGSVAINFNTNEGGTAFTYTGTRLQVEVGHPFQIGDQIAFEQVIKPAVGDPWWTGTGEQKTIAAQGIEGYTPYQPMAYENDQRFAIHVAFMNAMQPMSADAAPLRVYSLAVANGGIPETSHVNSTAEGNFLQLIKSKLGTA